LGTGNLSCAVAEICILSAEGEAGGKELLTESIRRETPAAFDRFYGEQALWAGGGLSALGVLVGLPFILLNQFLGRPHVLNSVFNSAFLILGFAPLLSGLLIWQGTQHEGLRVRLSGRRSLVLSVTTDSQLAWRLTAAAWTAAAAIATIAILLGVFS
jgi:hypothetical protein